MLKRARLIAISSPAILIYLLALLVANAQQLSAQQLQPANIDFEVSFDNVIEWMGHTRATITIEVTNINRPSENTKRIVVIAQPGYLRNDTDAFETAEQTKYKIADYDGKWFRLDDFVEGWLDLKFSEVVWPNDTGTILFNVNREKGGSVVISLQLDPGTYRAVSFVSSDVGTFTILDTTQGFAEGRTQRITLKSPTRLDRLFEKLATFESFLGAMILALFTILIGVLKENIKSAFSKFLDFLGKYFGGRLAERRFLKRYLDNLVFNHKYLKLIGFNTSGISRPLLEEVFVSLRIGSNTTQLGSTNSESGGDRSAISFNTAFKRFRCMAILGRPGAGKTTTLSYALLAFAQEKAREHLGIDEQLLPIYVPLRRLSSTTRSIIEDVIDKETQILSTEILKEYPTNYFERKLRKGQCILLLDGLDEVIDEKTHRQIAERINSLVSAYPGNRFIVTCRTAGWKDLLSGEFEVLSAQDFDRNEIQRFVLGWHKAVITQSEYTRLQLDIPDEKKFEEAWTAHKERFVRPAIDVQSRSLIQAIDSNNRILAIAVNPMLLSLISLVHFSRQYLPRGRTVLYSQCLDLLIDSWDRTRDILSPGTGVTSIQKEAVLREIAFDFQIRGKGEDSRDNLERLIAGIALKLGISTPAKELLEDIETRSGLLTERSLDVFGFSHLTLQEYLVAKHIQLNHANYGLLAENFDNQGWREVILLYTGLVDDGTELITGVASSDSLERQKLAGYCIGDAQHCDSNVAQRVIDRLLRELTHNPKFADEIVNVIAAIAADFSLEPVSVEEKLSAHLIGKIQDETSLKSDRLHAIAALGRSRVTQSLKSLIGSLNNADEAIRTEAVKAITLFGDLALPAIQELVVELSRNPGRPELIESVKPVVDVLSGINTGSSARLLQYLYDLRHPDVDLLVSRAVSQMMVNPFVEAELLELEDAQLPLSLRNIPIDRTGWSYKSARSGFWHLDTKLRYDMSRIISESSKGEVFDAASLDNLSFKILFPAFLSYLRSLPKTRVKPQKEQAARESFTIFDQLGFDKSESNKLHHLINQIQTQFEVPLDLALQRVDNRNKADYTYKASRWAVLGVWVADIYFFVLQLFVLFYAFRAVVFISTFEYTRRTMPLRDVVLSCIFILAPLFYLALMLVTKRKLKKGIMSRKFYNVVAFPIRNFLNVLPYITKQRPAIKLLLFQVLVLGLSPLLIALWPSPLDYLLNLRFLTYSPRTFLIWTEPWFFLPLSVLFWKYKVLAQNPVYELITMHPKGRKLIGESN
ncbi:MAG TPA: NACHT domain-containing protein [Pyrinomonadaceae bacterium]|nr:NACHT domain-containing protein [Pyrinomonadaceae bacterium]